MSAPATLDLEAFAHIVAHDLGAPIRGMSIHLRLLGTELEAGDKAAALERVALLQQRLGRLDEMLRRVRDFSKVHAAGEQTIVTDLGALVAEALEHCAPSKVNIRCMGRGEARGPPLLVLTVLQELIRNAIAHHDGTPHVTVEIRGDAVIITDDGPGLPADAGAIAQLFSLAGRNVREGAGSGLALSHYIVRHLGGDLDIRSPVDGGRGVQVRVRFGPAHSDVAVTGRRQRS